MGNIAYILFDVAQGAAIRGADRHTLVYPDKATALALAEGYAHFGHIVRVVEVDLDIEVLI